jgi:hypothetical protein
LIKFVRADRFSLLDQPLGHFLGRAERKLAARDLRLDVRTIERACLLAVDHGLALVLGPHVVIGRGRHIAARNRIGLLAGRIAAVMPQHIVEIEKVRRVFVERLRAVLRHPRVGHHADLVGPEQIAVLAELPAEIRDHVLHHAAMRVMDRGAEVTSGRAFDRLLRARERNPHRRVRRLIGPRPDRDILVFPELALVAECVFLPRLEDHLERLVEPRARFRHRHVIDLVFARHAAREARHNAPAREVVGHRQLLGDAQRIVQRQQVAEDEELQLFRALRACRRHHVRRVHQPVRGGVVLVQTDAVIAEPVHLLPDGEVLLVGARRDFRVEIRAAQRKRHMTAGLELVEVTVERQEIEQKDLHGCSFFRVAPVESALAARRRRRAQR